MIDTNFFSIHTKRLKEKHRSSAPRRGLRRVGRVLAGVTALLLLALLVPHILRFKSAQSLCANSISCATDLSGAFESGKKSEFMGSSVNDLHNLPESSGFENVLGVSTGVKHIYVDLSSQRLTAYEGSRLVFLFPVSTGKWGPTPTGDFHIWVKLRYAHMEGGDKENGTYYDLYNVPYTMFFYNDQVPKSAGFSLHGAYWHDNFGHPMSHGCVNLRPEDAAKLYFWTDPPVSASTTYASDTDPGTVVTITGQPPEE